MINSQFNSLYYSNSNYNALTQIQQKRVNIASEAKQAAGIYPELISQYQLIDSKLAAEEKTLQQKTAINTPQILAYQAQLATDGVKPQTPGLNTASYIKPIIQKRTPEPVLSFFSDMWAKNRKDSVTAIEAIDEKLGKIAVYDYSTYPELKAQHELLKKQLLQERQTLLNGYNQYKQGEEFAKVLMEDPQKIPTKTILTSVEIPQITELSYGLSDTQLADVIASAEKDISLETVMEKKDQLLKLKAEQNKRSNLKAGMTNEDANKMASIQKEIDTNKFNALAIKQKQIVLAYQAQASAENAPEIAFQYAELSKKLANEEDISVAKVKVLDKAKAELKAKYENPITPPKPPITPPADRNLIMQLIQLLIKLLGRR